MIAWRLVKTRFKDDPLSTVGAVRYGGRWNPPGVAVLYCSSTLALAALEILVHVRAGISTVHYHAVEIEIPDGSIGSLRAEDLPDTWRTVPCDPGVQAIGSAWVEGGTTLALDVPSVIVPTERNLLLNPEHALFEQVRGVRMFSFEFDPRLG